MRRNQQDEEKTEKLKVFTADREKRWESLSGNSVYGCLLWARKLTFPQNIHGV